MDTIWLYGIKCSVKIGVPPAERKKRQTLRVDVGMELSTSEAALRDDFRLTADYWAVEKAVRASAEAGERQLVETLAEKVAAVVLQKEPRIRAVTVAVHKKPAVMPNTSDVVVTIHRSRQL